MLGAGVAVRSLETQGPILVVVGGGGGSAFMLKEKKKITSAMNAARQPRTINNRLINMRVKWLKCIQIKTAFRNYSHCWLA